MRVAAFPHRGCLVLFLLSADASESESSLMGKGEDFADVDVLAAADEEDGGGQG